MAAWLRKLKKDIRLNHVIYWMILPALCYFVIFHYIPMYGAQIAFRKYAPGRGIWGSPWVGFENFARFFSSRQFGRLLGNTLILSGLDILFGFPMPVILALLLNEVRQSGFKRVVQTVTYIPHFISMVVICGLLVDFSLTTGLFNKLGGLFGLPAVSMLSDPRYFRPLYIASGIWQEAGWGSIIYLAALSSVDTELYDAASVDGAGKLRQVWNVTLPGIAPTIIIMLILRVGRVMDVGFEKILLLYNPSTYEVADVISTYVYRIGMLQADYSYSTAIGLFNSVINCVLLVVVNRFSRKLTETSLW
ncbi:MAG: sugar ABC transporter permease [Provencibacterium sp.]|jgi:putative aldouronate transport system permease protein|nr:sugar ABC transporter permease [Provencibacterium sp.]